jgi:hypothetical protein
MQHMHAMVDALVLAGSGFRPAPDGGQFWWTAGGPFCYMDRPIDFVVARAVPGQPADLSFVDDNDLIACKLCWATIQGPTHASPRR